MYIDSKGFELKQFDVVIYKGIVAMLKKYESENLYLIFDTGNNNTSQLLLDDHKLQYIEKIAELPEPCESDKIIYWIQFFDTLERLKKELNQKDLIFKVKTIYRQNHSR